ncbi:MAG TPA: endo-1,4-beta-xylanase [Pirellulales bacterium]|nr:endo-1,4-beta-xylanase [Pirellulales bacterium]
MGISSANKISRRSALANGAMIAAGLAVGPLAARAQNLAPQANKARKITGRDSLKSHAAHHGLLAGTAVNVRALGAQPEYARVLAEQYDIVVAENAMKWGPLRPTPDTFFFTDADALMAFAAEHKMKVRGHNLCWHSQLPTWFASTVTKENAHRFLVDHITTVAGRYRGRIEAWDVVNEAVQVSDGRPDGLRNGPWMKLLGPEYIDLAFRTARQADSHALLTYNDYGVENSSEDATKKRAAVLALLRGMKARNTPLDALGIQSHIHTGGSFGAGIRDFMASARDLGLKIFLTEMDVNDSNLTYNDIARTDHAVAETYRDYLTTTLAEPAVTAVLTWGFTDRYTWLAGGFRGQSKHPQRPLPFDANYQPTEAFFAIRDAFDHRKTPRTAV